MIGINVSSLKLLNSYILNIPPSVKLCDLSSDHALYRGILYGIPQSSILG